MTWKQKTICRILLIMAKMMAEDKETHNELKHLASHIQVNAPEGFEQMKSPDFPPEV